MFLTPDEVSRLYDIQGVLGTNSRKMLCPFPEHTHNNYTPSFSVFFSEGKQRFRCHGCGKTGDVIDLIGYLHIPGYNHDNPLNIKTAINILTNGKYNMSPVLPPPPKPTAIYQGEWKCYLPPGKEALRYMEKRGISDVGKEFCLGQYNEVGAKYLSIPCFHNDVLQGIKLRLIEGHGPRYKAVTGSRAGLFNHDRILPVTGTVFIVKGEIAAMVMASFAYYACAPTNGESGDITPFMSAFANASQLILIGDNDYYVNKQIKDSTNKRAELLGAKIFFPPKNYKDIDEWLLDSPDQAQTTLNHLLGE
jgi:hypothetical protein